MNIFFLSFFFSLHILLSLSSLNPLHEKATPMSLGMTNVLAENFTNMFRILIFADKRNSVKYSELQKLMKQRLARRGDGSTGAIS